MAAALTLAVVLVGICARFCVDFNEEASLQFFEGIQENSDGKVAACEREIQTCRKKLCGVALGMSV